MKVVLFNYWRSSASHRVRIGLVQRLANDAWLRRIPDDPGALLRARFQLEHERRLQQGDTP